MGALFILWGEHVQLDASRVLEQVKGSIEKQLKKNCLKRFFTSGRLAQVLDESIEALDVAVESFKVNTVCSMTNA